MDLISETESMKILATVFFILAVIHTFAVKQISLYANKFNTGSIQENLFQFLGEVEIVFGFWAAVFIAIWSVRFGTDSAAAYLNQVDFTEPLFVFVIMCIAATKPIIDVSLWMLEKSIAISPFPKPLSKYCITLMAGPLLGSLITEPGAMTITALLLKDLMTQEKISLKFKYATLGLLFVNISLGGTLTSFAAPPVIMVAKPWGWNSLFMLEMFGLKAIATIFLGTLGTAIYFRRELLDSTLSPSTSSGTQNTHLSCPTTVGHTLASPTDNDGRSTPLSCPTTPEGRSAWASSSPLWVSFSHIFFMILIILNNHHIAFFMPVFLFFLGWCAVTKEYQSELKIKESLLVAFFLGSLVTLGNLQSWWLEPIITNFSDIFLYFGAITLTAVTDNAALTYLGSLIPSLNHSAKYYLVAGAVVGGGLTVIANAPNPVGYGILKSSFEDHEISPLKLFLGALPYTVLAGLVFLFI